MLAELAAANAAFAVIKEAVANVGDIMAAGQKLFEYFDAKAAIQKKVNENPGRSDMEEFMALEQLRQQEEHLRESMIYAGRPGMWDDWLKFQAEAARKREAAKRAAEREAKARKAKAEQLIETIALGIGVFILTVLVLWGAFFVLRSR